MAAESFSINSYHNFLRKRRIMASRCEDSGEIYLPPRPICRVSHSRNMEWMELSGKGTIVAFTTISIVPAAMAKRGYGRDRPYTTGFVALEEGPTVPARIEVSEGSAIQVGQPVKATFLEETEEDATTVTLAFRPL